MISKLALSLILLAAPGTTASNGKPPPGSYGFNWLDPARVTCKKLTEKDVAKFSKCTVTPNAFGLEVESHACRVSAKVEFIVYKTRAQCQEGLETMQSNGDRGLKYLRWREKPWQQRALLVLTAVALVLLAAHPELRLLVPVVDLLGLDLVFLLAATQVMDVLRPALDFAWRALSPTAGQLYFFFIFSLGIVGPYVDGRLRNRSRA